MRDERRYFARHQTDRGLDTSETDFLKSLAAASAHGHSEGPDLVSFRIIHVFFSRDGNGMEHRQPAGCATAADLARGDHRTPAKDEVLILF